jgi:hypothetical protein
MAAVAFWRAGLVVKLVWGRTGQLAKKLKFRPSPEMDQWE